MVVYKFKKVSMERKQQIIQMYQTMSAPEIARSLNISESTVRRDLKGAEKVHLYSHVVSEIIDNIKLGKDAQEVERRVLQEHYANKLSASQAAYIRKQVVVALGSDPFQTPKNSSKKKRQLRTKTIHEISKDTYRAMMHRCYSPQNPNWRSYGAMGVRVCEEWHNFKEFNNWFIVNYVEGWEIDKDVLSRTLYSPDTCIFLPEHINQFIKHWASPDCIDLRTNSIKTRLCGKTVQLDCGDMVDAIEQLDLLREMALEKYIFALENEKEMTDSKRNSIAALKSSLQ